MWDHVQNDDTTNERARRHRRVSPRREGREQVERESSIGREVVEARVYALIAMRRESPGNPRTMEATYTPGRQKIARKDLPESRSCEEKSPERRGDVPCRIRVPLQLPEESRMRPVVKRITYASHQEEFETLAISLSRGKEPSRFMNPPPLDRGSSTRFLSKGGRVDGWELIANATTKLLNRLPPGWNRYPN